MTLPLSRAQLQHVVQLVAEYIRRQQSTYRPQGAPLSAGQLQTMRSFFSDTLLEDTRLLVLGSSPFGSGSLDSGALDSGALDSDCLDKFDSRSLHTKDKAAHARVANPDFYPLLRGMGITNLVDFSQMAAITFANVVVSHEAFGLRLLFHELVHVEQYRQLGVDRFAELYVRGFLTGGGYEGIPLEVQAYSLDKRFHHAPNQRFEVATEVAHAISQGRL